MIFLPLCKLIIQVYEPPLSKLQFLSKGQFPLTFSHYHLASSVGLLLTLTSHKELGLALRREVEWLYQLASYSFTYSTHGELATRTAAPTAAAAVPNTDNHIDIDSCLAICTFRPASNYTHKESGSRAKRFCAPKNTYHL